MVKATGFIVALAALAAPLAARSAETFLVENIQITDEVAVSATVESLNILPARVRTGGTIVSLSAHEGDQVKQGQVIAATSDRKLDRQSAALEAEIAGQRAQLAQSKAELERNRPLFENGVISQTAMESLRTAVAVAESGVKAREAERAAHGEQISQGEILAPASGRVLSVDTAIGTVVMPGEGIATIARQDMVVRLFLPERHARSLTVGEAVKIEGGDLPAEGTISLIYPHVVQGQIQADAAIAMPSSYFVGQRLRAWVALEPRKGIAVPASYLITRFGMDFARVRTKDGSDIEVPVQRGPSVSMQGGGDGLEILTGLRPGDLLVRP